MRPLGPPPLIVLDVATAAGLRPAADALRHAGWEVIDRLDGLPLQVDRLVCMSIVDDAEGAAAAILGASWGAGLLVGIAGAEADVRERLIDDLARIRPVSRRPPTAEPAIHPDAARLLELLGAGRTLGEAASEMFLSRRTADRRVAEARRALGADTTAEAIARWARRTT